jgi:hypothetical protein
MAPGAALALTNRDAAAPTLASVFDQFGLPAPRTDCPQRMPTYPNFPFSSGNIDNPQLTQADAARAPLPHMVEITKEYSSPLPGHADSGKPIDRDFPTNAALDRYSQQRDRAAFWYDHGIHLQASLQVLEQAPGLWTWELKDPGGSVLNPGRAYQTRELALEALDRVRFLFHELCYEP